MTPSFILPSILIPATGLLFHFCSF
ncbi:hypothetical protein [Paenibacillus sp. BJ-4]